MYFSLISILFLMNAATQAASLEYDYADDVLVGVGGVHDHPHHHEVIAPVQIVSNSLSLSKDWALRFDEELGRGDTISHDKKIELEDNMIRMAEILHFIPERPVSKRHEIHLAQLINRHHPPNPYTHMALDHPNPYTHIVVDPYKSVMIESGHNDIAEPEADHVNTKKSPTPPPPPHHSRPNIRARHPKFAMHGI
ncbi:hypothetical protein Ocin01_13162 [Orchesella cincta]|uniref:Uncharacterized protein n=1 Tax=Orchesella cincta TaxID=48709 RepID=A0A1D2MKJ8_ORCCI|nr:hypothetical protein Ocin01_13162 [Orchesella cincta]